MKNSRKLRISFSDEDFFLRAKQSNIIMEKSIYSGETFLDFRDYIFFEIENSKVLLKTIDVILMNITEVISLF